MGQGWIPARHLLIAIGERRQTWDGVKPSTHHSHYLRQARGPPDDVPLACNSEIATIERVPLPVQQENLPVLERPATAPRRHVPGVRVPGQANCSNTRIDHDKHADEADAVMFCRGNALQRRNTCWKIAALLSETACRSR